MKTRKQLEAEIRASFIHQCKAHDVDPEGPVRGVINNLLCWILEDWQEAFEENEQLRRLATLRSYAAVVYNEAKHEPLPGPGYIHSGERHVAACPCAACAAKEDRAKRLAFGGRAGE